MAKRLTKKTILVETEEYERFKRRHPGHGDFTWFIRTAMRFYNELNDVKPDELVRTAVEELDKVRSEV